MEAGLDRMPGCQVSDMIDQLDALHFQELASLETWYWWHQVRFRRVWYHLRKAGVRSLVDVGCGTGGFLEFLRCQGVDPLHGFEGSPTAMAILAGRRIPHTPWVFGGSAIREHEGRYGAATLMDVLEHVDDDVGLLAEVASLVQPDGRIAVTVPADPRLMSDWDRKLLHRRRYTRESLRILCAQAGLEIVTLEAAFRWAWLPGWWRRASQGSDLQFPRVGTMANKALLQGSLLESRILGRLPCGSGTSLFLIARKRGES